MRSFYALLLAGAAIASTVSAELQLSGNKVLNDLPILPIDPIDPIVIDGVCIESVECSTRGGKCMKQADCKLAAHQLQWTGYAFDPDLCDHQTSDDPDLACGCCLEEKVDPTPAPTVEKPCEQTSECKAVFGRCMKKEECSRLAEDNQWQNHKFDPELCLRPSSDLANGEDACGCCYDEKVDPTPAPTVEKPCEQTSECKAVFGRCMKKEECSRLAEDNQWQNHKFDPELCLRPSSDLANGEDACGCCYKGVTREPTNAPTDAQTVDPTKKPTRSPIVKPCVQSKTCTYKLKGKCLDAETCKEKHPDFLMNKFVCKGADCVCCHPRPTAKPTRSPIVKPCVQTKLCARKKGKCMSPMRCEELGPNFISSLNLCVGKECTCCIPKQTEEPTIAPTIDEPCKQTPDCKKNGGFCADYDECKERYDSIGFKFEPHLCKPDPTGAASSDCGCCIPEEIQTSPPTIDEPCHPTDECKLKNGKCSSYEKCKASFSDGQFMWEAKLCRNNGETDDADLSCGCCIYIK